MVSEDKDIKELRNSAQCIQGSLCTSKMLAVTRSSPPHRGAMALLAGWPSATSNHQQTHFPGQWDQNGSLLGSAPRTMLDFLIWRENVGIALLPSALPHLFFSLPGTWTRSLKTALDTDITNMKTKARKIENGRWEKERSVGLWGLPWATELALFGFHVTYDQQTPVYYTTIGMVIWAVQWNVLLFNTISAGEE